MGELKTGSILAAGACAALLLAACGGSEKTEPGAESRAALTVTTVAATATTLPRVVEASGTVSPWEEVPVGAELGGLVAEAVYVDEGSAVRQGQPLLKMNDALLRAQLAQQEAQVASARAQLSQADAALARARELFERRYLSQAALDQATANQRTAAANLQAARAGLGETRTRLSQTVVRAPVSGLITARSVVKGQIVPAGQELFRMTREGRLELDAQVPETDLPLVRAGQSAEVAGDQVGTVTGRVRVVTPQVDPQTRLGLARIALPAGSGFRPGMFARARIDAGAAEAVTVPQASLIYREGRPGVFVVGQGDVVRYRPVVAGERLGDLVAVQAGLTAGERVVMQGAGFLVEGDKVLIGATPTRTASAAGAVAK
jgi:RND family efflux transporter MFP subunit